VLPLKSAWPMRPPAGGGVSQRDGPRLGVVLPPTEPGSWQTAGRHPPSCLRRGSRLCPRCSARGLVLRPAVDVAEMHGACVAAGAPTRVEAAEGGSQVQQALRANLAQGLLAAADQQLPDLLGVLGAQRGPSLRSDHRDLGGACAVPLLPAARTRQRLPGRPQPGSRSTERSTCNSSRALPGLMPLAFSRSIICSFRDSFSGSTGFLPLSSL